MTPAAVTTDDGLALHVREWPAARPAPRGTVWILHGLGEHIGRHEDVAQELAAAGWRVVGYDQRGHGRSPGARGRLGESHDLLRDLAHVLDATRTTGPRVLLGHSMGGVTAARFVAEGLGEAPAPWHRRMDALVLSSPALAADLNVFQKLQLSLGTALAPGLPAPNGLPVDALSRDTRVVEAYQADPLVHDRITPRLARFILSAGDEVLALAPRWATPTLLMWAGSDRCAAPRGVVRSRCFEALFHEIFKEPERTEVFAELLRWLQGLK
ncbi:MAG TPA: alpha/beta hydrolase [Burkholderiaceae bacterium]|nr:alpha/beta hydrolase [Burkholderiaceae bacterium]